MTLQWQHTEAGWYTEAQGRASVTQEINGKWWAIVYPNRRAVHGTNVGEFTSARNARVACELWWAEHEAQA